MNHQNHYEHNSLSHSTASLLLTPFLMMITVYNDDDDENIAATLNWAAVALLMRTGLRVTNADYFD
jgi:hypothetical protein